MLPRVPSHSDVQIEDLAFSADEIRSLPGSVPPRTPYEEVVHGIWRDVLGDVLDGSDFGVHDDFFELGGHSLAAPRIVARIRKALDVQIPVLEFFGCRTVAALAAVVAARSSAGPQVIERRPAQAESVLSFDQQRMWLESQLLPSLAYNVHGRQRLVGPLDVAALEASVRAIVIRHEALRTRFPVVAGRPVQVVDDIGEDWGLDLRDLTGYADPAGRAEHAARLANEQASTPFDLAAGPLLRCLLIKLSDTEHVLSLTAHHIVCDDWSVGLFVRELSVLYQAGGDPRRAGLEPLPIQYRDYAAWQRERLVGDTLERTVSYWRHHLAGAPPALTMPVAHRSNGNREHGDWTRGQLTEDDTTALHTLCRAYGVSPFMVLMAVLATVLARWSGQRDLIIGVPIAGRTDAGTDALIGFLVNTLPIRIDLTGDPTFTDLLSRVRQVCLDGYAHSDAPLDVLVQQLDITRDPRHTPLFQVVLNAVGNPAVPTLPGITIEPMDAPPAQPTKLDLALNVQESDHRMQFQLDFNPERYDRPMIAALVRHLETLLRAAIDDPTRGILDYRLDPEPASPAGDDPASTGSAVTIAGAWAAGRHDLTGRDRVTALTHHPGVLVAAMTSARTAGATFCAPPDYTTADISAWLRDNTITVAFVSLPQLRSLTGQLPALRYAFIHHDGDLIPHDIAALRRHAPDCQPVGIYHVSRDGQPLATYPVPASWHPATAPPRVPLGTELPGHPARLAHPAGQPAATGEVAELHTSTHPTGHLARRWTDGTLEYVGTVGTNPARDPVQTLSALRDLPEITDAIVTEHTNSDGNPALTAYVTSSGPPRHGTEIRQDLVLRLPDYLTPARLYVVDHFPRTPHGDYDRTALPQPDEDDLSGQSYVAPRTPLERQLTEIFEELLGLERIGVHDSFFELNGFSLLATQMTSRVREVFDIELPLREVFGAPTAAGLAQLILWKQSERTDTAQLEAMLAEIEGEHA
jgi:acyl carrier protein